LIHAIGCLSKAEQRKIKIDIYGEGPYSDSLNSLVVEKNLADVFCFKGSISNLYEIYHQYDYLIHPSSGETFCYSVVESLLCKLPVITTINAGNVLGLVQNELNGYLFKEEDYKELNEVLKNIINEDKGISKSSFESVNFPDFSLTKMVKEHVNLLP
jgi:glycosyltransferase involved in cell wall biosynthesis